ncbi:serine/threonine protein phosphatase [Sphingomonas yunnanensis]|nr:serine/threonine protein phosphatase [Sphingomonas yunnanensis]
MRHERHAAPAGARPGDRPLYAIGDIHGCYDHLHALLAWVARDAGERSPGVAPVLVLLGDYVDRGPDSAKVLAALAWLARSSAITARLLEGNHEAMFRLFMERPAMHGQWLRYGGSETLRSYGVAPPEHEEEADGGVLTALRDRLFDAMPVAHYRLLERLEPMVRVGDYTFVHAGVRPGVSLRAQERDDLLWIRDEFLDHPRPAETIVVHGHTWANERAVLLPYRIGLDTGAYETGVLSALRIDAEGLAIVQAVAAG